MNQDIDIRENDILAFDEKLLPVLLIDRSTSQNGETHNIIWATDNYVPMGHGEFDEITLEDITGENGLVLRPRVRKTLAEQEYRSRDKAEVFTSAWICNKQNNLIDAAWFGGESPFNVESDEGWITKTDPISFPEGKTWKDYVLDTRLEMACGEAPYLVSRYNVVSGDEIPVVERIGILDRKLRVVGENTTEKADWFHWALAAFRSTYGFEWQGDSLLLAREAMIYSLFDYHEAKYGCLPTKAQTHKVAETVSWNIWQMDGLKGVVPGSCQDIVQEDFDLFGGSTKTVIKCQGCLKDDITRHNGIYCLVRDWEKGKNVRFIDLLK